MIIDTALGETLSYMYTGDRLTLEKVSAEVDKRSNSSKWYIHKSGYRKISQTVFNASQYYGPGYEARKL